MSGDKITIEPAGDLKNSELATRVAASDPHEDGWERVKETKSNDFDW